MTASTAEYQRERNATLRGLAHKRVLDTAYEMARSMQKKGKHYTRATLNALKSDARKAKRRAQ